MCCTVPSFLRSGNLKMMDLDLGDKQLIRSAIKLTGGLPPPGLAEPQPQWGCIHTWQRAGDNEGHKAHLAREGRCGHPSSLSVYVVSPVWGTTLLPAHKLTNVCHTSSLSTCEYHQQPEVNHLPRFSPQLISPARYTLSVYRAGEIDLFENLDQVHIFGALVLCIKPTLSPPKPQRYGVIKESCDIRLLVVVRQPD